MIVTNEILKGLKKVTDYKWRVQSVNEYGATCVAYIDSRQVQDIFDEVVGPENWQAEFRLIGEDLFCRIGIRVTHEDGVVEWIWKEDVGVESNVDKRKGNASDSLKRASVHHGVGRFLYCQDIQKLKTKKYTNNKWYPIDDTGEILWDGKQLTEYIERKLKNPEKKTPVTNSTLNLRREPENKISQEIIDKISKLSKNNIKGKDCLAHYLPEYNKAKAKDLKLANLDNDKVIEELINFINNIPPDGLK